MSYSVEDIVIALRKPLIVIEDTRYSDIHNVVLMNIFFDNIASINLFKKKNNTIRDVQ